MTNEEKDCIVELTTWVIQVEDKIKNKNYSILDNFCMSKESILEEYKETIYEAFKSKIEEISL